MLPTVMHSRIQRSVFLQVSAIVLLLLSLVFSTAALAGDTTIAVASNFAGAAKTIATAFEEETGLEVTLAFGSTGRHYAQIKNGAPFAVFLAADTERPRLLEEEGIALEGSRFTYAVGKLVLWSPDPDLIDAEGAVLGTSATPELPFHHLAIANPKLAPYGAAAQQVLMRLGRWNELQDHYVRGENIGQTFQFVQSGNAELGFVAYSQVVGINGMATGSYWLPPQSTYDPIAQQAVLLNDDPVARFFVEFLRGPTAQKIIARYGYDVQNGYDLLRPDEEKP